MPDYGFFSLQPILCSFCILANISTMPFCYSCHGIAWSVLAGPLSSLQELPLLLKYSGLVLSLGLHSCFFGLFNPFHCLRVSLANFFLLGHPRPISFPRASLAHSNSIFPCVFAKSFGLFRPNYYILHLWGLWVFHQPFTHLIQIGRAHV